MQTLNKHAAKLDPKLYATVVEELKDLLYFFGYTNHPEYENQYAFFKFDTHKEEHLKEFMGYKKLNQESIELICSNPDIAENFEYRLFQPDKTLHLSMIPRLPNPVEFLLSGQELRL